MDDDIESNKIENRLTIQRKRRENDSTYAEKKKSNPCIYILLVFACLLIILVCFLKRIVKKNRMFNTVDMCKGLVRSPNIIPANMISTYYKPSEGGSPHHIPSLRYRFDDFHSIGFDLNKLKPGDIILTRKILSYEKRDEISLLKRLLPKYNWKRKWVLPDTLKRFRENFNGESIIQTYSGENLPTHICIVARVKREDNKDVSLDNVEIWNFNMNDRTVLSLREFVQSYSCTVARHWVLHLNRGASNELINTTESYFENVSIPKYWKTLVFSFIARNRGLCILNRKLFFKSMNVLLNGGESVLEDDDEIEEYTTSPISLKALDNPTTFSIVKSCCLVNDDQSLKHLGPCKQPYILKSSQPNISSSSSILIDKEDGGNSDEIISVDEWKNWKGLDQQYFSCSSIVYAILEACGLTLSLTSTPTFYHSSDNKGENLSAGNCRVLNVENVLKMSQQDAETKNLDSNRLKNEVWLNPCLKLRILAPHQIAPCDFLRSDFQWSDGVYVKYASRVFFHVGDE